MNAAQRQMRAQVQSHIDAMEGRGLDLNECGTVWRKSEGFEHRRPHKYIEFVLGIYVGDAHVDDWFPLVEDGLVDLDESASSIFVATWLLA